MSKFKQLYKDIVESLCKAYIMKFVFLDHHKYDIRVYITIVGFVNKYQKLAEIFGIQDFKLPVNLVSIHTKDGNVIKIFAPCPLIVDIHNRIKEIVVFHSEILEFVRYHK